MQNRRKLTDDRLDQVSGGSWQTYDMDPNNVHCECGGTLKTDILDGRMDMGHYTCSRCGMSYYNDTDKNVWMIDRNTGSGSGC